MRLLRTLIRLKKKKKKKKRKKKSNFVQQNVGIGLAFQQKKKKLDSWGLESKEKRRRRIEHVVNYKVKIQQFLSQRDVGIKFFF